MLAGFVGMGLGVFAVVTGRWQDVFTPFIALFVVCLSPLYVLIPRFFGILPQRVCDWLDEVQKGGE
jgi:hypothetical protein